METNLHWNDMIFHTVDWDGMWACMDKLSDIRVTHVIKLVHGWQNYEQQTDLFYNNNDSYGFPAGCGYGENRMYFIQYTATKFHEGQIKRRLEFRKIHNKNAIWRTSKNYNVITEWEESICYNHKL